MKKLLIISNTPSLNTEKMAQAILTGAQHPDIEDLCAQHITPLNVTPDNVIEADAIILGTTENLAYMSGELKTFFDRCYYPCLEKTQGKPFCLYIRAGHDGTGARLAIEKIVTGLRWREIHAPLICKGDFQASFIKDCEELGMYTAAGLEAGIF
jgi:flavorubredoxin